jgi:hypothetical protein
MFCHGFVALTALGMLISPLPAHGFQHHEKRGPATLDVRSDSDQKTLALADVLHVVVTLDDTKGLNVEAPVRLGPGSAWEVVSTATTDAKTAADGRWRQTLTVAPTAPGELTLQLTPLILRDRDGREQTLAWQAIAVSVETQIKEIDPRHARDITAIEELPPSSAANPMLWLWILAPLTALLVVAAVVVLMRRRADATPASALRKAMRECDRLLALKLGPRDQGKGFIVLLTGIVRRYLERRFDLPARRQTTAELLGSIRARSDIDDQAKQWLQEFFGEADLVRYAGAEIGAERCTELVEQVRRFCTDTSAAVKVAER